MSIKTSLVMLNIAGEVAGAAAGAAGLILVFFGAAMNGFDSYGAADEDAVRVKYRWRTYPAALGFVLALASCGLALHAKAMHCAGTAIAAVLLLAAVGLCILFSIGVALRDLG